MIGIMRALWWIAASGFKSRQRPEAENLALRHQVPVLRRSAPERLRLCGWDRFPFVYLYWLWPSVLSSIGIVQPETVCAGIGAASRSFGSGRPEELRAGQGPPELPGRRGRTDISSDRSDRSDESDWIM